MKKSPSQTTDTCDGMTATAKLHKILAKDPTQQLGLIKLPNGEYTNTDEETLAAMMEAHFPSSTPPNATRENRSPSVIPVEDLEANKIVSREKVRWAISSFEPFKSPGPDGIFPALLQRAPYNVISGLCSLFKSALALNHTPSIWKASKIVFISKPGRNDYHMPKSFRPISLSSVILKRMEKLVDRHIRDSYLTVKNLSNDQHAFRGGRSTDSALHALIYDVEKAMHSKESALCVFLDIEGAFDNTKSESILRAAADKGVSSGLVSWIGSTLTDRPLTATLNGKSISRVTSKGCPQGVLAPLEWLMVIDGLLTTLRSQGFECHGYADDIVITVRGKFRQTLCEVMHKALDAVERWCVQHELAVNPTKSNLLLFTRERNKSLPKLNGLPSLLVGFGKLERCQI